MQFNYSNIISKFGKERVKINEPMSFHTTMKIGGPVDLYVEAFTKEELGNIITLCQKERIPYFVMGLGSNILVSDKGIRGVVIRNRTSKIKIVGVKGKINLSQKFIKNVIVEAESGVLLNQLVRFTLDEGLAGLEYFLGLPGTVGGAVWNNSHNERLKKYFGELILQAEIITVSGDIKIVDQKYFQFGYDRSKIQKTGETILSVALSLFSGIKEDLWKIATGELNYRQKSHAPCPSFGCTFQNIKKSDALRLATPNQTTSAGYLLDSLGLKGTQIGGAQISPQHANFILNTGGAKAQDVVQLIKLCKEKVKEKYGVELKEEIVYLGEF